MVQYDWAGLLLLPAAPSDVKEGASSTVATPGAGEQVETCGRAYHNIQFVPKKKDPSEEAEEDDQGGADNEVKEALREKLDRKGLDLEDYYALMGLEEFGWKSTEEQIRANWKHISFVCHPDKSAPENRAYGEKRFKNMQLAFTTLTDKQKRIGYDSALPFDEKIPSDKEGTTEETFFKTYGPVFDRNARFSTIRSVPLLGDKDTPMTEVDKFYDFWLGFKSWRDFTHLDEHKNDDGTDRFTRRENDRKNAKLRAGAKKAEGARVRKLVEDGMKKDPRVQRQRAAEEAEIKRRKEEKKEKARAAKQAAEDEVKAKAQAIEDANNAEKNAKDKIKKQASNYNKMKKKIKKLCKSGRGGEFDEAHVEIVSKGATYEQLEEITTALTLHSGPTNPPLSEDEVQDCQDKFAAALRTLRSDEENAAADALLAAEKEKKEAERAAQQDKDLRVWNEEEEAVLAKAVAKYPNEWVIMTDLVNDVSSYKRSKKEVIHKAKEIEAKLAQDAQSKSAPAAAVPEPATSSAAPAAAAEDDDWSTEQQAALEAALKKVKPDTPKRFEVIAPLVPGKTKKECVQRFKSLRAKAMASKNKKDWYYDADFHAIPCYEGCVLTEEEKQFVEDVKAGKGPTL